jgi:hypothetical protein
MTSQPPASPRTSTAPADEPSSRAVLDRVRRGHVLIEDALTELADADAADGIAGLIAQRLDVDAELIAGVLDAASDEPATALCRAAGLNINVFSAVLRMRRRQRPSEVRPAEALNAFLHMPMETARDVVRAMIRCGLQDGRKGDRSAIR